MAKKNSFDGKAVSGPMWLVGGGAAIIILIILSFGITALYYFINFMKTDFMGTGVPIWLIIAVIFGMMMINRNKRN